MCLTDKRFYRNVPHRRPIGICQLSWAGDFFMEWSCHFHVTNEQRCYPNDIEGHASERGVEGF